VIRLTLLAAAAAALVTVTAYTTSWLTRSLESTCSTKPISGTWAQDRAYKATLLRKDCNLSETIFYAVRIDAFSPLLRHAWFTIEEIGDDERPPAPPTLRWTGAQNLAIEMVTKTLRGSLVRNVGQDLTTSVTYVARLPMAFPNYE
jgi:hypothetical protein